MFQLDLKSRKSIYEQVVDNIKELIIAGVLAPDDKLPSVRELSRTLTVNPNTVQKAYRELERQSYLYTVSGLGSFVSSREQKMDPQKIAEIRTILERELKELMFMGYTPDDIKQLISQLLEERRSVK